MNGEELFLEPDAKLKHGLAIDLLPVLPPLHSLSLCYYGHSPTQSRGCCHGEISIKDACFSIDNLGGFFPVWLVYISFPFLSDFWLNPRNRIFYIFFGNNTFGVVF